MENQFRKIKVGSICKQRNPINQENAKSRYVVTEVDDKTLSCYHVKESTHTHRNILIKDMVLTDEQADYER
jgi:hypothetical protein